jgi:hypothetical protein
MVVTPVFIRRHPSLLRRHPDRRKQGIGRDLVGQIRQYEPSSDRNGERAVARDPLMVTAKLNGVHPGHQARWTPWWAVGETGSSIATGPIGDSDKAGPAGVQTVFLSRLGKPSPIPIRPMVASRPRSPSHDVQEVGVTGSRSDGWVSPLRCPVPHDGGNLRALHQVAGWPSVRMTRNMLLLARLGPRVRIPWPAPVPSPTNFLRPIQAVKKARTRAVLRVRLGVDNPERYGISLSERLSLSEAWGLADLLYKLFPQCYQSNLIYK